jgi:hypothetical protein
MQDHLFFVGNEMFLKLYNVPVIIYVHDNNNKTDRTCIKNCFIIFDNLSFK